MTVGGVEAEIAGVEDMVGAGGYVFLGPVG